MTIRKRVTAAAVTAVLAGVLPAIGAAPAGAQQGVPEPPEADARGQVRPGARESGWSDLLVGDFVGDEREEAFFYGYGTQPDRLVQFGRDGSGAVTTTSTAFTVSAYYYSPAVANIDGDPQDEIIWYGFGTQADYIWNFTSPTSHTSTPIGINGEYYELLAGDFRGDGTDDIIFYGPRLDYLWDYESDGSHTSSNVPIGGSYYPVVGSFGSDEADDVFWYGFGPQADHLWDFRVGGGGPNWRDLAVNVNGYYWPFGLDQYGHGTGGSDIFWYGYGSEPDSFWDYRDGALRRTANDPVNGFYYPVDAGDLFGDGAEDVLWVGDANSTYTGNGPVNVWDQTVDGGNLVRTRYTLPAKFWLNATATATRQADAGL